MEYKESPELKEINRLIKELMDLYYEVSLKSSLSESAFDILYALVSMGSGCMQKGHGKNKHLFLTDAGKKLVSEKIIPVMQMEAGIFAEMKPGEGKEFLRLFQEYIRIYRERIVSRK